MAFLKQYLRRDRDARVAVAAVERYVGELRQERTKLKDETIAITDNLEAARKSQDAATQEVVDFTREYEQLLAKYKQLEVSVSRANAQTKMVREEITAWHQELDEHSNEQHVPHGLKVFRGLLKTLRRRNKYLPALHEMKEVPMYSVASFFTDKKSHREGMYQLGNFVVVCAMIGWDVGFFSPAILTDSEGKKARDDLSKWASGWFACVVTDNSWDGKSLGLIPSHIRKACAFFRQKAYPLHEETVKEKEGFL